VTGPRIEIVGGGEPGPEEIAAVVLALTPVVRQPEVAARGPMESVAAWRLAAMLEGVGDAAPVVSSADLGARRLR
jgi:hypothetical protein